MTRLQSRALSGVPLSTATVASFYDGSRSGTAEQCLKALCESHERLRMEMEGLQVLHDGLLNVIKEVHEQHADDLCWMDIDLIFRAAGLPVPDRKVGDKEAMLRNCDRYISTMCQGGQWQSYAELEQETARLKQSLVAAADKLLCLLRDVSSGSQAAVVFSCSVACEGCDKCRRAQRHLDAVGGLKELSGELRALGGEESP